MLGRQPCTKSTLARASKGVAQPVMCSGISNRTCWPKEKGKECFICKK